MKKNIFILIMFFSIIITLFCRAGNVNGRDSVSDIKIADYEYSEIENPLPVPPLLKNSSTDPLKASFSLTVQKGLTEFFKGTGVITYGYNGSLLGPTLRFRRGQSVDISVKNSLNEVTTVHWHGMLVPGDVDGGPHQIIKSGGLWHPAFKVNQPAATAWYHPHGLGTTAVQVYKGLAGLIIIDDEVSDKLNIPKNYGVNDIPLIVQDRRFTSEGVPVYMTSMHDMMQGMLGNTILVNGTVNPVLKAERIRYRFRILNGSNARVYDFRFSSGLKFHQITTDGGFLEKPYYTESIRLSPGERAEIIADFSELKEGSILYLKSGNFDILKIVVSGTQKDITVIPEELARIDRIPLEKSQGDRYFSLQGMGPGVNINGKQFNPYRIDENIKYDSVETWHIRNVSGMGMGMMGGGMMGGNVLHNFHAHGIQFMITDRGGRIPSPSEQGWKDTVLIEQNEDVSVIVRFLYKGVFMYHCHILEHEDNGMMGQFKVN
ncbi:MAG: copper oxidase [Spirochaetae bacterium HGW-Spirochaetae-5]|nr:MAG: copper oxidase [Spirochaetae bacterium HGW-Spirochaetae-5]